MGKVIIALITLPLKILIGIISTLLSLIKQIIGIPLNPTKIPEWLKGIVIQFKEFVDLLKDLPTKDGIMNLLFLSDNGLKMIDIFVPGFAKFAENLRNKSDDLKTQVDNLEKNIKNKQEELKDKEESKNKRQIKLVNDLQLVKSVKDGDGVKALNDANKKIENKKSVLNNNIELLKITANNVNSQSFENINDELNKTCDFLNDLNKTIQNNTEKYNSLIKKNPEELNKELENLEFQINNLNNVYDTEKLNKEIKIEKNNLEEFKNQYNVLRNFAGWKDNISDLQNIVDDMIIKENSKENPYTKQVKIKNSKIDKNKKEIENIESIINGNANLTELNRKSNRININIENLKNDICSNRNNMNNNELSNKLTQLSILSKIKNDIDKDIEKKSYLSNQDINELLNKKNSLQEDILKTQKEKNVLFEKEVEFKENNQNNVEELTEINKRMPVIMNIVSTCPKFIGNIFVGLLNSVAYMEYLPTLWEFPLID